METSFVALSLTTLLTAVSCGSPSTTSRPTDGVNPMYEPAPGATQPSASITAAIEISRSCQNVTVSLSNQGPEASPVGVLTTVVLEGDGKELISRELATTEQLLVGQTKTFEMKVPGYSQRLEVVVRGGFAADARMKESCPSIM